MGGLISWILKLFVGFTMPSPRKILWIACGVCLVGLGITTYLKVNAYLAEKEHLREQVATLSRDLEAETTRADAEHEANLKIAHALEVEQAAHKAAEAAVTSLNEKFDQFRKDQAAHDAVLSKHDLAALAKAKPGLIGKLATRATNERLHELQEAIR
jgi:cell division protein FtsX